mmetsp:Transcript_14058/g.21038  ORF Transcript_14058/g.21038 Transcript_14058/m.21038 type:complete len:543 (+) Transcript_14058:443-2071(+)
MDQRNQMKPSANSDPNGPPPGARDEAGGRTLTGNSPLVPLDSIFNDTDASREEFSQRYMENVAFNRGQGQGQEGPPTDYAQRQYDADQSSGFRYGFGDPSMRQGGVNPQDTQAHVASRPSWSSHPGANFPPRHASQQQDTWYGRDSTSSTTATHSSPQRQMLPQQYDNNQYPMHGGGGGPSAGPGPQQSRSSEGYPYSPQPPYGGGYHPNYYPFAHNFPDHRSPDPRYAPYPGAYPQYPGYYPQDPYYSQRSPHGGPYGRPDFMPGGVGSGIPAQMAMGYKIPFIKDINENDVLCGRGGATNSHSGNRSYRKLVKKFKDKYLKAKKKQKPSVAAEVVDIIRTLDPPGRFLKKDKDTGWYLDIGDARAKEKTSQALREGAPMIRKQMTEGKYVADGDSDDESPEKDLTKSDEKAYADDDDDSVSSPTEQVKVESDLQSAAPASDNNDEGEAKKLPSDKDVENKGSEESKKRPSPVKVGEIGESPLKRQNIGKAGSESPQKKGKNDELLRDVFEPPRASIGKDSDDGSNGGSDDDRQGGKGASK